MLLLLLLFPALGFAQTTQDLLLNSISSFSPNNTPNPPIFALPKSNNLTISVALCSVTNPPPRFFVSNSSDAGGMDRFEILLDSGQGSWTGALPDRATLAVEDVGPASFEVGVSDQGMSLLFLHLELSEPSVVGRIHETLPQLPFLGDTTSNQALLFSPPFDPPPYTPPTYPNYTLPPANLSLPSPPSNSPNFTLVILATADSVSIPRTGCFLSSQQSVGTPARKDLWLRDRKGWRSQWFMEGLTPSTNYTAYIVQDEIKVSGPIYFATKSRSFSIYLLQTPLAHSLQPHSHVH